jgi:3-phenylpropionate/trans-cinnamate dioxygenase ferredoxin reductase subunit
MTGDASQTFVVVGAGLAAGKAVEELREAGFEGRIIVYGDERERPYERPPLSKDYLIGSSERDTIFVHPPEWYDEHGVELRLTTRVTGLDTSAREVVTSTGERQPYDKLLLATGASPRRLAMADESGAPVAYLRTVEDSERLKAALTPGARITIIGGGWIGLEVAAAARQADAEVTVVEAADLPLLRVLGPEVAEVFASLHREHGVDLRVGASVSAVEADGEVAVVRLGDGSSVEADLLVVGVGVSPNVSVAESAGLDLDNGVLVDARLRTSVSDIYAAGDVANAEHPLLGHRIRVEHWDNAIEQGKVAGRNMAGGDVAYDRLPYFFTDQYDLGIEYVGHTSADGYDEVVLRGDPGSYVFTAFWISDGRVTAGMHANDWDAIDSVRAIVSGGDRVDLGALRDSSVPLEKIASTVT